MSILCRRNNKKIFDLTYALTPDSTVYPGDSSVRILEESSISKHGFATDKLEFCNHTGTHIDYQCHFHKGGNTSSDMPLEKLLELETIILDFSKDSITKITQSDIEKKIRGINCDGYKALIFKTANSKLDLSSSTFKESYIGIDIGACNFVIAIFSNLSVVGIDYLSIEPNQNHDFPVHKKFLEKEINILTGLKLDEIHLEECSLNICPLKLKDSNGSPVRCFASPLEKSKVLLFFFKMKRYFK